jgi:hypothetical protein
MFLQRITVSNSSRAVLTRNNRFVDILRSGKHTIFVPPFSRVNTERHSLLNPIFESVWVEYLLSARPDVVAEHFRLLKTSDQELAFISVAGELHKVVLPHRRLLLWRDAENVAVEFVNVIEAPEAPETMLPDFEQLETRLTTPSLSLSDPRCDDSSSHGELFDVFSFESEHDES